MWAACQHVLQEVALPAIRKTSVCPWSLLSQAVPSLNIAYTQEKGYVTADIAEKEKLTKLNLSGGRETESRC
jgi:hypothetical protein